MQRRVVALLLVALLAAPFAYASGVQFGDCPRSSGGTKHECDETPDTSPFPPHAVTGHTVYASFVIRQINNESLGLPTDFAVIAGYFEFNKQNEIKRQRECVTWFNGYNLDQRPDPDNNGWGAEQSFPSDEDQLPPGGAPPNQDTAAQDYDFDRDIESCLPVVNMTQTQEHANYAVVTEAGDCDPRTGRDFEFRAHLDFVDPNHIYHEVQEYGYTCGHGWYRNNAPNPAFLGTEEQVPEMIRDFVPEEFYALDDGEGCDYTGPPTGPNPAYDAARMVLRDATCSSRIQNLFYEQLWITEIHTPVMDPYILKPYNFAVQFDTCDGNNCHDGSRDSFDDTSRGTTVHESTPTGPGADEQMRGNSFDFDPASDTFGTHRTNCRHALVRWKDNSHQPPPGNSHCYPEDHRSAQIDVWVFDQDPTGLFQINSNGLTGPNAYVGPGLKTAPNWDLSP